MLLCQVEVDPELDPQNIQYDLEALGEHGFTVHTAQQCICRDESNCLDR